MNDKEFIEFLVNLLWDFVTDGTEIIDSEWETIDQELLKRGMDKITDEY